MFFRNLSPAQDPPSFRAPRYLVSLWPITCSATRRLLLLRRALATARRQGRNKGRAVWPAASCPVPESYAEPNRLFGKSHVAAGGMKG